MREIKFRAWHCDAVEMLYEDQPGDVFRWKNEGQPVILEEFIGLYDEEGAEACEGDITMTHGGIMYRVVRLQDEAKFVLELITDHPFATIELDLTSLEMTVHKIIGNIHENPKLLKKI